MKTLKLHNGEEINFTDTSTIYDLTSVVANASEIDEVRAKLTKANLAECEFDGEEYTLIVPVGMNATSEMTGNITVHFTTRDMTDVEKLQQSQSEQDDAINFLLMQ